MRILVAIVIDKELCRFLDCFLDFASCVPGWDARVTAAEDGYTGENGIGKTAAVRD